MILTEGGGELISSKSMSALIMYDLIAHFMYHTATPDTAKIATHTGIFVCVEKRKKCVFEIVKGCNGLLALFFLNFEAGMV
jgi:hypothetical protein